MLVPGGWREREVLERIQSCRATRAELENAKGRAEQRRQTLFHPQLVGQGLSSRDEEGVLLVRDVEVAHSMLVQDVVVDAELESGAALAVTNSHTINTASQVARRAQIDILTDVGIRG